MFFLIYVVLKSYKPSKVKETEAMTNLPKIALGAWAWGNDGTFGNNFTADSLELNVIRFWEKEMK